jgi:hypothetical protein
MTADAPGFWMAETSGVLRPAVEAYLNRRELTPEQIATLRAYFRQWVCATAWDANPHAGDEDRARLAQLRGDVDRLTTREAIDHWLDDMVTAGMDPL